jgi:alkylation response protein AidB-like acyl-CoA dehydrogenase
MDLTRKQARVQLSSTPARLVGADGGAWAGLERVLDLASIAVANESVGCAQAALDMAVEYAKVRIQYGRAIGSFQAVKHKCADMLLAVESSRSVAQAAAGAVVEGSEDVAVLASMAKAWAGENCWLVTAENIQIHGGIGFTWEHPAHLYLKRAKSSELLFGDPAYHRERVARLVGI